MAATVMLNDMLQIAKVGIAGIAACSDKPGHRVKVKVNIKLSFVAGVM